MPIARPVGHNAIPSQMPSRSTVSGSGQPGKLRGRGCSWRQSQGCSGIKQNIPLSDRASQHLAPAAGEQINIIVATELHFFFVCESLCFTSLFCKVVLSLSLFISFATSSFCTSPADPLVLLCCRVSGFNFISCAKLHTPKVFVPFFFFFLFFAWSKENNNSKLNLKVLRRFLWLKACELRCPGRAPQSPEYPGSSAKGWYSTS